MVNGSGVYLSAVPKDAAEHRASSMRSSASAEHKAAGGGGGASNAEATPQLASDRRDSSDGYLTAAKSMPDLPKVNAQ